MATEVLRQAVSEPSSTVNSELPTSFPPLHNEKIVATGSGITVGIALMEPVLFLCGFNHCDPSSRKAAILRGQLHIKTFKCVGIKKVSICFRGRAQTDWPDGTPNWNARFREKMDLFTHGVIYFAEGDTALMQNEYGANSYLHAKPASPDPSREVTTSSTGELVSKAGPATSIGQLARKTKRLLLLSNHGHSRSSIHDFHTGALMQPQHNCRMFPAGDYLYDFEFPLDSSLPETINSELGFARYDLEVAVERSGAFRPNLTCTMEIPVIRTPPEDSQGLHEQIAISRDWEDQLHYDITISGNSFPLGSQIPIAFKLTPLAKVECHWIKVYVTENVQYWRANKSAHRFQPAKKVLLFEKRADSTSTSTYPGSSMRLTAGGGVNHSHLVAAADGEEIVDQSQTNILGNVSSDGGGATEMEFYVQLPNCRQMKGCEDSQCLHLDTTYENIRINHWIKVFSTRPVDFS